MQLLSRLPSSATHAKRTSESKKAMVIVFGILKMETMRKPSNISATRRNIKTSMPVGLRNETKLTMATKGMSRVIIRPNS